MMAQFVIDSKALPKALYEYLLQEAPLLPTSVIWEILLKINPPPSQLNYCSLNENGILDNSNLMKWVSKIEESLRECCSEIYEFNRLCGKKNETLVENNDCLNLSIEGAKQNRRKILQIIAPHISAAPKYLQRENILVSPDIPKKEGFLCDNKNQVITEPLDTPGIPQSLFIPFNIDEPQPLPSYTGSIDDEIMWKWNRVLHVSKCMNLEIFFGNYVLEEEKLENKSHNVGMLSSEGLTGFSAASAILEVFRSADALQILNLYYFLGQKDISTLRTDSTTNRLIRDNSSESNLCFFPGMVVAAKGRITRDTYGKKITITDILCGSLLPSPETPLLLANPSFSSHFIEKDNNSELSHLREIHICDLYCNNPVNIIVASIQSIYFSKDLSWAYNKNGIDHFFNSLVDSKPHAVVLMGPVIPSPLIDNMKSDMLFDLPDLEYIYKDLYISILKCVQKLHKRTRIYIVPSPKDMFHSMPLPQSPYPPSLFVSDLEPLSAELSSSMPGHQQICFLPNPSFIYINEIKILLTSCDPLMEIGGHVLMPSLLSEAKHSLAEPTISGEPPPVQGEHTQQMTSAKNMEIKSAITEMNLMIKIDAALSALLKQLTLFPRGPTHTLPIDTRRFPPVLFEPKTCPHLIIFPSSAKSFSDQQDAMLYPSSGYKTGAFARFVHERLFVVPFSPSDQLVLGGASWTHICIHPPILQKDSSSPTEPERREDTTDNISSSGYDCRYFESKNKTILMNLEKRIVVYHKSSMPSFC